MPLRALLCLALAGFFATSAWAQSATLDKIRKSGVITMGYVEGSIPFSFKDAAGQPQGYSISLCNEIAAGIRSQLKLAQLETRWVPLTIQDRLNAVRSGRVDIECSTTTWTLSRQAEVDFSLITFVDGGSILTHGDSELRRLVDFDGKRIAVINPKDYSMSDAVAIMTGAMQPPEEGAKGPSHHYQVGEEIAQTQ